jgi:hypothetical protein
MTDLMCALPGDRGEILAAYLYDELDPAARRRFEEHLPGCTACGLEVAELRAVRTRLGDWTPPAPAVRRLYPERAIDAGGRRTLAARLGQVPLWAQAAAALLIVGVAAGLANLDVRYGHDGLTVRTGWSRPAPATSALAVAPWRSDLAALETELRAELRPAATPSRPVASRTADDAPPAAGVARVREADIVRRVRALVEESEHRQQRELALRVAEVLRDVNVQRQADLVKIDRSLGLIQNNTGVEVLKQREVLNYLVRVSQKQ